MGAFGKTTHFILDTKKVSINLQKQNLDRVHFLTTMQQKKSVTEPEPCRYSKIFSKTKVDQKGNGKM